MEPAAGSSPATPPRSIYDHVAALANVATALGILLVVAQLFMEARAQKQANTVQMISRFDDEYLANAKYSIFKIFSQPAFSTLAREGDLTPGKMAEYVTRYMESEADAGRRDVEASFYKINGYFDSIYVCSETRSCDPALIKDHLSGFAREYFCTFEAYIKAVRARSPGFAVGLEEVAHMKRGAACGQ